MRLFAKSTKTKTTTFIILLLITPGLAASQSRATSRQSPETSEMQIGHLRRSIRTSFARRLSLKSRRGSISPQLTRLLERRDCFFAQGCGLNGTFNPGGNHEDSWPPPSRLRITHSPVLPPGYNFVDIGPPTGLNAYVLVEDMNEQDQVVGSYFVDDGLFGSFHAFLWEKGVFTDLGAPEAPSGSTDSTPVKINNRGQVLCNSIMYDDNLGVVGYKAWVWEQGVWTEIAYPGADYIEVRGLNEKGQVAGTFDIGEDVRAFLWDKGVRTDLGNLGAPFAYAFTSDINDRGQIAGASAAADRRIHAFVWQNGVMSDLGLFNGSTRTIASLINNRGQIAGFLINRNTGAIDAFLWDRGQVTALGISTSSDVTVWDIRGLNDKGEIIGTTFNADKTWHGFVWRDGELTDLTFPGAVNLGGPFTPISDALDINERSQVVGWSVDASGEEAHAFLWDSGVLTDLASRIPGFPIHSATRINERSQIAGQWLTDIFQNRGFILTPTP